MRIAPGRYLGRPATNNARARPAGGKAADHKAIVQFFDRRYTWRPRSGARGLGMFGEYRTTGGLRLAFRNPIRAGRDMSFAKAASLAILLLIGSSIIARTATMDEVARCRAIQVSSARWQCFKSLRTPKRHAGRAKSDGAPKAQTGDAPRTEDVPKTKSEDVQAEGRRGKQETASDDPASTASIDHLSVSSGQPVCVDQDSLAAALIAGMLASDPEQATTNGCQTIPKDAQVELLQRYPSGLDFLRVIKVKATSPAQSDSTVGYTVEIGR